MSAKSLILKDKDFDAITLTISMKGKHIRFELWDEFTKRVLRITVPYDEFKLGMKYLREPTRFVKQIVPAPGAGETKRGE